MADCPKLSRREIERTLVETILVKNYENRKKSQIAYPILEKCRKNPVHDLGNNELAEKQNSV